MFNRNTAMERNINALKKYHLKTAVLCFVQYNLIKKNGCPILLYRTGSNHPQIMKLTTNYANIRDFGTHSGSNPLRCLVWDT